MRFLLSSFIINSALAALISPVLLAQASAAADTGSRVRLTLSGGRGQVVGTYVRRYGDSIQVRSSSSGSDPGSALSLRDVTRIEIFAGRHHPYGKTVAIGAGIGIGAGAILGFSAGEDCDKPGASFLCFDRGATAVFGAVALGGLGTLLGLLVGAAGVERWVPGALSGWPVAINTGKGGVLLTWGIPLRGQ